MILNRTELFDLINSNIIDNNLQLITPEKHREVLYSIVDSFLNLLNDDDKYRLTFWESGSYKLGDCILGNGINGIDGTIYSANVSNTSTTFNIAEWREVSTYIPDISNFDDFMLKQNAIELNDKKSIVFPNNTPIQNINYTSIFRTGISDNALVDNKSYPELGTNTILKIQNNSNSHNALSFVNDKLYYYTGTNWVKLLTTNDIDSMINKIDKLENADDYTLIKSKSDNNVQKSSIYTVNNDAEFRIVLAKSDANQKIIFCNYHFVLYETEYEVSGHNIIKFQKYGYLSPTIINSVTFTALSPARIYFESVELSDSITINNTSTYFLQIFIEYIYCQYSNTVADVNSTTSMSYLDVVYNNSLNINFLSSVFFQRFYRFPDFTLNNKADKLTTPTSTDQLSSLRVDENGQYQTSNNFYVKDNIEFNQVLQLEGFDIINIFLTENLSFEFDSILNISARRINIYNDVKINIDSDITFNFLNSENTSIRVFSHITTFGDRTITILGLYNNIFNNFYFNGVNCDTALSNGQLTFVANDYIAPYKSIININSLHNIDLVYSTTNVTLNIIDWDRNTTDKIKILRKVSESLYYSNNTRMFAVMETGKLYQYISEGSSYTIDNINVLATKDGGNTRFVALDTIHQNNIKADKLLDVADYQQLSMLQTDENGQYQTSNVFYVNSQNELKLAMESANESIFITVMSNITLPYTININPITTNININGAKLTLSYTTINNVRNSSCEIIINNSVENGGNINLTYNNDNNGRVNLYLNSLYYTSYISNLNIINNTTSGIFAIYYQNKLNVNLVSTLGNNIFTNNNLKIENKIVRTYDITSNNQIINGAFHLGYRVTNIMFEFATPNTFSIAKILVNNSQMTDYEYIAVGKDTSADIEKYMINLTGNTILGIGDKIKNTTMNNSIACISASCNIKVNFINFQSCKLTIEQEKLF